MERLGRWGGKARERGEDIQDEGEGKEIGKTK